RIREYRLMYNEEPQVIWLQNHGIFVAADTIDEIESIYTDILGKLERVISNRLPVEEMDDSANTKEILPALRMMLSGDGLKTLRVRNNGLIDSFCRNSEKQQEI